MLADAGLTERARVIMEKPFGTDLASARKLNDLVHQVLREEQVFRIDHFLGKEAAQNILALRFANGLFEPIWNRDHIDHIQIDVPETLAVGSRAAFYEQTGAYRDMVVTHLMQILAFVAMEPPTALDPEPITEEKNKVFRSLRPLDPDAGRARPVRGLPRRTRRRPELQHRDLRRAALRDRQLALDRRAVLPAHRQAHGRRRADHLDRLPRAAAEHVPRAARGSARYGPDHLTFDLDESSRVSLSFYGKRPGTGMVLDKASMQFSLDETDYRGDTLEAYERLIRDAMVGDHTLFTTAEGIERLWEVSAPLLEHPPPVKPYPPGSWGPTEIGALIAPHSWRLPFARRWREAPVRTAHPARRSLHLQSRHIDPVTVIRKER